MMSSPSHGPLHRVARVAVLCAALSVDATAQGGPNGSTIPSGGEWERYLRAQQVAGNLPPRMWTIRGLSDIELDALPRTGNAEWDARRAGKTRTTAKLNWSVAPAEAGVVYNSAFPYGMNDGPLWAGRGATVFATGGVSARLGHVALTLSPFVFAAQNQSFELAPTGRIGRLEFANWVHPGNIDLPQRFGDGEYARIDGGESALRADLGPVALGVSTASEFWGPAVENPLILGNNGGGFPHAFLGTSHPTTIGPVRIHGRILWGKLTQSAYGPQPLGYRHFATGAAGALGFKGVPGLEIGASRFFHSNWPEDGLLHADLFAAFEGLLKNSLANPDNPSGNNPFDNQLASIFARWVLPSSRLELYVEYGREDHSWNFRDIALEPDHDSAYLLGFQRAWSKTPSVVTVLRGEIVNSRISHLATSAQQAAWYVHSVMRTGHTERGQLLAAPGGFGGGATTVAVDRYSARGRTTVRWDRIMRAEHLPDGVIPDPHGADVMTSLRFERLRFVKGGELLTTIGGVLEMNRNFSGDRFNVTSTVSYRVRP